MPCIKIPGGFMTVAGPDHHIKIDGEIFTFEDHHYCGPIPDVKAGNVATPRPLPVPPVKPGSKPWDPRERLDWAEKASGAGNEDYGDAQEPIE